MSPIPGEPHEPKPREVTTKDGRTFKLKIPGLAPIGDTPATAQRGSAEPPRDDPRPRINPNHAGF